MTTILTAPNGHFELYTDAAKEWRWRYRSNGRVIADSGESYRNKSDALSGIEIMKNSDGSPIRE